jgi:basic amino acid/polyamine antiporter, APA family
MWFGISAAVGNTIAAGIVRAPGDIAQWLPNIYLFFGVWVVGGLYALSGASSLAELGAAIPRSGGQYNFSRRALGEYAGFIVGWSDWLSTCGTAAAVAIVIGEYSGELIRPLTGHVNLIAVLIIVGFFILQWRGIKWGSGTQLVTAAMKTFAFVIVVAACFLFGSHTKAGASVSTPPAPLLPSGWPLALAVLLGLQAVFYTIDGWDGIIYFGEEVRNPGRDIPRAIFGSVATIMGIYLLINAAVLYVLPMSQIGGNNFVLGTAAEKIFGPYGDTLIRAIMVISLLSCLNANQLFCSRTLYAMSCDGLFFRSFMRVNAGGTPTLSLLLSTIVGVLFVLVSTLKLAGLSPFELVIDMLSFFFVANYTLSYWSLFTLRKKEPQMERPYRAWGYPWTTGIALFASALFLIASITPDLKSALTTGKVWPPSPAMLALLILLLSYPMFRLLRWVTRRNESRV